MKLAPLLFILTAVAFGASAGTFAWLMGRYLPGVPAAEMFLHASVIAKLAMMLSQTLTFGALVLGVIGLFVRSAAATFRLLLMLIAAASAGLGMLAALYGWMNIQAAIRAVGAASLEVTAPGYAETLLALSVGLFGALVALGFRAVLGRRA